MNVSITSEDIKNLFEWFVGRPNMWIFIVIGLVCYLIIYWQALQCWRFSNVLQILRDKLRDTREIMYRRENSTSEVIEINNRELVKNQWIIDFSWREVGDDKPRLFHPFGWFTRT